MPVQIRPRSVAALARARGERRAHKQARGLEAAEKSLAIGLINNMPDPALDSTQRQFFELLDSASQDIAVELQLFYLPDVPRGEAARLQLSNAYLGPDELWRSRLDALIVTGTEPRAPSLRDEPYWASLTRVVEWAQQNTKSTIWSCLAAHAAVLHMDGVERRTLPDKRFGVFACTKAAPHPLLAGPASGICVAHSRWNELLEEDLTRAGYTILTRAAEAGVDTFIKHKNSLFVFFQGHPEYDARALLREYRRDVGRFLRGERQTFPSVPQGYFQPKALDVLASFRAQAESQRSESLLGEFPGPFLDSARAATPTEGVSRLYRNWLSYLCRRKSEEAFLSGAAGRNPSHQDIAAAARVI